ncbi:EAL domain-containing protein [Sphingomonas silueang]|uniref:EAL domain-containing protein n=1 Tax=Sphingomonas silueang TaxID=3156617 RepID=UPI0032B3CB47
MQNGGLRAALRSLVQGVDDSPAALADRAQRLVREAEDHGPTWFWQTDRAGRVTYLSDKIAAAFAAHGIDAPGMALTDLVRIAGDGGDGSERTIAYHLNARTAFADYAVTPAMRSGEPVHWTLSGSPYADRFGRFEGFVGTGSDTGAIRRSDAAITRLALFDSLTGLANRQRMRLALEQALAQGGYDGTALFLLDLDRFKAVNDTLGHPVGDALLKQVAARLTACVGEAGLVGRLGGDEFQVVLPRTGDRIGLSALAQSIIAALSQPFFIDAATVSIGASVGIALSPDHGATPDALVEHADLALYAAKHAGRGVHRFFHDALLDGARARKQLEADLAQALGRDELRLVYQPVVHTADGAIHGYEALLRWDHPARGRLMPADFLPIAADCALIEPIGEWVLRTACAEAVRWGGDIRLSVNLADAQLRNPALPGLVANALARSGLPGDLLELDIAEASVLHDLPAAARRLAALKAIGVRLALNDFGAGPASLACLRALPFDRIKIDRAFIEGVGDASGRNAAVVRAVVTLADALGIETTAKGVAYHDEIASVQALGCTAIQGFVYDEPCDADTARARLAHGGRAATVAGPRASRAPRTRMLRSATVEVAGRPVGARIRDLSSTGVLIDSIDLTQQPLGQPLRIEIAEGEWAPARLQWASDGRAGLQFDQPIVVDRRVMRRRRGSGG